MAQDAVALGDLGDLAAPRLAQGRGRRVVHVGHAVEDAGALVAAGRAEVPGIEAVAVEGKRPQLEPEEPRQVLDAGIGQRLDHQGVAGPGQRPQRDGQRLLGAAGHDHALRVGGEAAPADPARQHLAVARLALAEAVVEQAFQVALAAHLGQGAPQGRAQRDLDRLVAAEVDRAVRCALCRAVRRAPGRRRHGQAAHEGAAAHLADHQALGLGQRVGAVDRADRDLEAFGQNAHGRQALAGLEPALADVLGQALRDGAVERAASFRQVRLPDCFHNNNSVDSGRYGDISIIQGTQTQIVLVTIS